MPLTRIRPLLIAWIALEVFSLSAYAQQEPRRTRSPHGALEIPCQNCHASESWKPIRPAPDFDHNRQTQYPLVGQHQTVACVSCHVEPVFTNVAENCSSCHADIHRRQFGSSCESCHTVKGWRVQIDALQHHANRFPLIAAHAVADCESCHRGAASGVFTGLSTACVSCHVADYNRTTNPDHRATGFPITCQNCHADTSWRGAQFDHNLSRFPLTGVHTTVTCSKCHVGNQFAGASQACISCHSLQFTATITPNHVAAGFPQDCASCHATSGWRPASFDHSRTRFPLTGAHTSSSCASCHSSGQYATVSTTCVSCHLTRYTATTNPNHVTAGFPQDCQVCHTTTQWNGATFDHSRTRFLLTGAHTTTQCASCHIGGRYAGTPMGCYSCHSREFTTITSPNHVAAGFPKTCETCHTTVTWIGATITHRFPIYSGAHAGRWSTCNECHTNTSNYTVFSCLNCHAHDRTPMDNKHRNIRGYVYDSLTCYGCHPTGKH